MKNPNDSAFLHQAEKPAGPGAGEYSALALAFLGDAYFCLLVRERLVRDDPFCGAGLSEKAVGYVNAVAQSAAIEKLLQAATPEEEAAYKRGRNAKPPHTPRGVPVCDYRRATGLETLFGYLYIQGEHARARYLFEFCFPKPTV